MTAIPDDGENMSTTGVTSGEGEVTAMSSDPSPVNNNIPEDDAPVAPGRTIIQQHDQHSSIPKVSEKESVPLNELSTSSTNTTTTPTIQSIKIKVHLVAVGSAPILKKSKFLMNADDRFAVAIAFLRKVLKLSTTSSSTSSVSNTLGTKSSSLFLYVNAAFVPSPDERIGDLFDCFGSRGELVVHYSLQEAWG